MRAIGLVILLCCLAVGARAQAPLEEDAPARLPEPEGPVVLTLTGEIAASNRGPFEPDRDALFALQDAAFETAAAFDRAMLERLGVQSFETRLPDWPAARRVTGPRLAEVLQRAGAGGETLVLHGVNGFSVTLSRNALEARQAIVALRADGRWLNLGGRGPAWIVYPHNGAAEEAGGEALRPVWGVVRIEVRP